MKRKFKTFCESFEKKKKYTTKQLGKMGFFYFKNILYWIKSLILV